MAEQTLGHKAGSITDEFLVEIVRKLGLMIASLGLPNPDEGVLQFSAGLYNHGNRSQTDDLLEEIILRLQVVGDNIEGGGSGTDERVKVSANDTVAKFLLQAFDASSEIGLSEQNDGADEKLKILALIASAAGVRARIGNIPLNESTAKLTVRPETGQRAFEVQSDAGTPRIYVSSNGDLVFEGFGSTERGFQLKQDSSLFAGNNWVGDAKIRLFPSGNIRLYSGTSRMEVNDDLYFLPEARIKDNNGNTIMAMVGGSSYQVLNAARLQTGIVFSRTDMASPFIGFRHGGIINVNGQGGVASRLLFQNNGVNKLEIDADGNLIYYTPQYTGFADAAAVQAASIPAGSIAQTTNGTLVRKL